MIDDLKGGIVGLMAVSDFPMARDCMRDLCRYVDGIVVWYDILHGDKEVLGNCCAALPEMVPMTILKGLKVWNRWNWREDMIRALDDISPDYVLAIDQDETFSKGFIEDFYHFRESGKDLMMFDYEMVTIDNRPVMKYPKARHCKAYRWVPGITYRPYRGYAKPTWPGGEPTIYNASTPIRHYCFFTEEMERTKKLHK